MRAQQVRLAFRYMLQQNGGRPGRQTVCPVELEYRGEIANESGSVDVHYHLVLINAAAEQIIARKLVSVLRALTAILLNSLTVWKKFSITCRPLPVVVVGGFLWHLVRADGAC